MAVILSIFVLSLLYYFLIKNVSLFSFEGRIDATDFWLSYCLLKIIYVVIFLICVSLQPIPLITIPLLLFIYILIIPIFVRRLHDLNLSGMYIFLLIIPIVNIIFVLQYLNSRNFFTSSSFFLSLLSILAVLIFPILLIFSDDSDEDENQYGPLPNVYFRKLRTWWNARGENAKAYTLLSPALILVVLGMAVPLIAVFSVSFTTQASFVIDYTPTFDRYIEFMDTSTRTGNVLTTLLGRSLSISFLVAFFTLLTTYPVAYYVAFYVKKNKMLWLVLMTLPFWTSYLLRVFAWKLILGHGGVINASLMTVGLIDEPLGFLMYSQAAVVITLAHAWAAFALLPLYVSLEKIDHSLIEASYDLGCTKFETFWRVVWPLSIPGVIGAVLIIFIPTVGDYVTPALVGGTEGRMLSNMIQTYFGRANNFPLGAASAVIMLVCVALITFAVNVVTKRLTQRF